MMLCDKCGRPIEGPSGRCLHCVPADVAHTPSCVICTAPLLVDSFGAIICTGCNRSEQLCGCGTSGIKHGFEPEHPKASSREPSLREWLERLERAVKRQQETTGLNRNGEFLLKFACYSIFCDLVAVAVKENTRESKAIYQRAVKLVTPLT